jgi:uncharacterized protein involved in exopolysaccharide biosynthesis
VYRTLEVIFRHLTQLLLLLIVLPSLGLAVAFLLPRTYQTDAKLYAKHRQAVIGTTGPEANLQATPAQTQVTAMTEMLRSKTYALKIAKNSNLVGAMDLSADILTNQQKLDDTLYDEISKKVTVTEDGYQTYIISYECRDATIAKQVVASTIDTFSLYNQEVIAPEGNRYKNILLTQKQAAQKEADDAYNALRGYAQQHPNSNTVNDAVYAGYNDKYRDANQKVTDIQGRIDVIDQQILTQGTGEGTLYDVLDRPDVSSIPVARSKQLMIAGGIGLGIALVSGGVYIALLVRRDRSIRHLSHLQKAIPLPVLMQTPHFALPTEQILVERLPG